MDDEMEFKPPANDDAEMDLDDTGDFAPQEEGTEKDITKDGAVKKLLEKKGSGFEKPETGDDVKVHYTGTLLDGTKFDSSRDRDEPFTFKLGKGQVIKGWDVGVATMKKGEKAVFTIASDYAYGKAGSPPTIPGDATLKFEVELLDWTSVKDISGDGGIIKTVIHEGKKWEHPKDKDEVTVKVVGKLQNGEVFAKSPEEGTEFVLSSGFLCAAVPKALKTMYKEQKVELIVKPEYAFGPAGRPAEDGLAAVPPSETVKIDLELVSWKSVEKVTDDEGVMKKVLVEGEGYEKPNDGAKVTGRYVARLQDGTVFEMKGHEEGSPFEFLTDEEQVIEGLDKAVMKMKKGEKAIITIAPQYAFKGEGYKGPMAEVPPNATVVYEMELLSFVKAKESWDLENAEKIAAAGTRKEEGNVLFKEGKYARAAKKYAAGLKFIEYDSQFSDEEKKESKALQVVCQLNEAACRLKLKEFSEAVKLTSKVLETQSQNVKALFRRAQAYIGTADYDLAEWDLKKAMGIEPANRDLKLEFRNLKVKLAEQNKKEAKLYGNMFARLNKLEEKEKKVEGKDVELQGTKAEVAPAAEPSASEMEVEAAPGAAA
eukprot:TRINITY_DN38413_c0_g1_i1.p1 TRINITY_DN38413_c0_g1~~TRINITY_DN38413_c0_g1_i1.p1  ORF type:complete len:597 (-),score=203.22 TRINITY_DN38413_c0_g1_i1:734-2524(-)